MYLRAKNPVFNQGKDIQFYQFRDWIQMDLIKLTQLGEPMSSTLKSSGSGLRDFQANNQSFKRKQNPQMSGSMGINKLSLIMGQGLKLNDVNKLNLGPGKNLPKKSLKITKYQMESGTVVAHANVTDRLGSKLKQKEK